MWEIYGLLVKQWPQQLNLGRKNTNLLRVTLIRHQFKLVGCTAYSVRPLRLKLQKTSRKQKAADRVSVLCRLVFKKKKWERQALQWLFCTSSQTSLWVEKLNWTLREESLNWQMPGEGQIIRHASKSALIWCAQWLQQQVSQTGERTVGGATGKVHLNKANKGGANSSPTTSLRKRRGEYKH